MQSPMHKFKDLVESQDFYDSCTVSNIPKTWLQASALIFGFCNSFEQRVLAYINRVLISGYYRQLYSLQCTKDAAQS